MYNFLLKLRYKFFPVEMVQWWKTKEAVQAKVTTAEDGSYIMWMEGEKYPFPGYPRGHLITNGHTFSPYSRLKHEIKNQIFNENWARIERKEPLQTAEACKNIYAIAEELRYDMMPLERCAPAVREIAKNLSHTQWRDILTAIFQEDDAYRWRFQWMTQFLSKKDPIGSFDKAMEMLEHAEVVTDMKERIHLIRVVLLELWKDPTYARYWIEFIQNADLKKLKLTKADKYFFRAKYFKVDYPYYEY
jgi:hypothetical protein